MSNLRSFAAGAAALLLLPGAAIGQQRTLGPPSASVRIEVFSVAFIGQGQVGGGTLAFRGRNYPITVGGLGVGGIGAAKLTASGRVYGLRQREDFAGAYVQLREGWAVGRAGKGRMVLKNDKGVTISLDTRRQGLQLSLGADGVLIGFK